MCKRLYFCPLILMAIFSSQVFGGEISGNDKSFIPTDPNLIFNLEKLQSKSAPDFYIEFTATDSEGFDYTGSEYIARRVEEMYSDTLVIPKDFISNISLNGEVFATRITSYYDASNFNLVATENHTAGVTCQPTTPDKKPSKVKIGDHGVLSTLVCDNNTSQKSKWRVEDAGNNRICLINTTELMDQSSSLLVSSETIYTINLAGDIEGYKKIANLRDGHQLTIQGTNITEKASLAQSAINRITAIEPNDMKVLDVDLEKTCSCSLIQLERRIPFRCIVLLNIIYEEDGRKGQTKLLEMWDLVDGDWEYGFPDTLGLQDCPGEKR